MVHRKCRRVASQNQPLFKFSTIFWNAGGLTMSKILEFEHLVVENDPDAFVLIDAGSFCEKDDQLWWTKNLKWYDCWGEKGVIMPISSCKKDV
jgi:hypothetical protein